MCPCFTRVLTLVVFILILTPVFGVEDGQSAGECPSLSKYQKPEITILSWFPRVMYVSNFMSEQEVLHFRNISQGFSESKTMGSGPYGQRTSTTNWLQRSMEYTDDIVKSVVKRMHEVALVPVNHGEPLQIVRYDLGQKYEFHHDTDSRLGRIVTFLAYLTDVENGGETIFPFIENKNYNTNETTFLSEEVGNKSKTKKLPPPLDPYNLDLGVQPMDEYCHSDQFLKIRPKSGDALMFYSLLPNMRIDELTWHGSCPVISGSKLVAQRWIRASPDPRYNLHEMQ